MTDLFKDAIEQRQRAADADDASLPPSSLFPGLIVIGLLSAAIVVASIAEGYFTFYRVFERTPSQRIIRGCLAAIIVVVEIISMAFIVRSSSSRKQTSPSLIFHERHWAGPRLLLCLWWGIHFAALLCIGGDVAHLQFALDPTPYQQSATWIIRYVIELGLSFGENVFLFLAVSAAIGRGRLLRWLVRHRFLIDAALAGINLLLPLSAMRLLNFP